MSAGIGDVNGDGTDDIVWRNASGALHYWSMKNGERTGGIDIQKPPALGWGSDWTLAGIGNVLGK